MTAPLPGSGTPPPTAASGAASADAAVGNLIELLRKAGPRAERRATPRFGVLVSVLGALLVTVGAIQMAGSSAAGVIFVSLVLCAGGYYLVWTQREGPLASAGAAVSAAALPILVGSVLSLGVKSSSSATGAAVITLIVSVAGWLVAYFVGPGRGHVVYAAAALIGVAAGGVSVLGQSGSFVGAMLVLIFFAALYLGAGYLLDRREVAGLATAFVGVGVGLAIAACVLGVIGITGALVGDSLNDLFSSSGSSSSSRPSGSSSTRSFSGSSSSSRSSSSSTFDVVSATDLLLPGLLLIPGGIAMIRYGVGALRRATAWTGAVVSATGVFMFGYALFSKTAAAVSILLLVIGGGAIYGGFWIQRKLGEEGELEAAPSFGSVGLFQAVKTGRSVRVQPGDPLLWRSYGGAVVHGAPWPGAAAAAPGAPGPGWWLASDGNWYPPTGAPMAAPPPPPPAVPGAPGPGWWLASDGQWYPPTDGAPVAAASPEAPRPDPVARPVAPVPPATGPAGAPTPTPGPSPATAPGGPVRSGHIKRSPGFAPPAPTAAPAVEPSPPSGATGSPGPGWWLASDGNWYPPSSS